MQLISISQESGMLRLRAPDNPLGDSNTHNHVRDVGNVGYKAVTTYQRWPKPWVVDVDKDCVWSEGSRGLWDHMSEYRQVQGSAERRQTNFL